MPTFKFHHVWELPASVERTYAALADVERYDHWCPQVRRLQRIDDTSGRVTIRSVLPYPLHLVLTREVEDEAARLLRVRVDGDLRGWCQWTADDADEGAVAGRNTTRATFDQEAVVTPALLARTARLTAPVLRANHTWMMRAGRVGLARHLGRE